MTTPPIGELGTTAGLAPIIGVTKAAVRAGWRNASHSLRAPVRGLPKHGAS